MPTPFPIPDGFAQTTMTYSSVNLDEPVAVSVLGFSLGDTGTLSDLNDSIDTHWAGSMESIWSQVWALDSIRSVTMTTFAEKAINRVGDRSGAAQVSDNAILMKKITGLRGRKHEGRTFWPGFLNQGDVAGDGNITSATLDDFVTRIGTFFESINTDGYGLVVLHKDGSTPDPVVNLVSEFFVGVQRRRLGR